MKKNSRYILTLITDLVLVAFSVFSTSATLTKFYFMINVERLATAPYLLTFTGLSNLFIGIVALICLISRVVLRQVKLPKWIFILKLSSVSMITITLLTTVCYIVPSLGDTAWRMFINANLFNHLLTPICAICFFMIFEENAKIGYPYVLYSLIPMTIYSVFYLIRALPHYDPNQEVNLYYDIYGLTRMGIAATVGFLFAFHLVTLAVSTGLYFQNKSKKLRK
ncbi:MAG: hypothetical protein SPL00_03380 [Bacilli bacterium]|nr:hypothetical protein [Bacilli bacterium]